jgi:hypothetical protein
MNYRSVMVFGTATAVDDPDEKARALDALVEHVVPGRGADARPPTESELRATLVLKLAITEASAKVRTGGPIDDEADMTLPVWAGVVPARMTFGEPAPDAGVTEPVPAYAASYSR